MNKKNNRSNRGFAITSALMAWVVGLTALLGGGAYIANETFNNDVESWQRGSGASADHSFVPTHEDLEGIPSGELSEVEREGLISMREEEKLARDVYRTLFDKWGLQTFENISYSENRHTLAVKELLDRYNITDPVQDDATGVFTIPEMQALYNDLVAQGSGSLLDALKVGATIEDLDIYDLNRWIAENDNEDIAMVYDSLIRGSRNHMRAFDKQLTKNGGEYIAQYLTQAQIDSILGGDQEQGRHGGQGKQSVGGNGNGGGVGNPRGGHGRGGRGMGR